MLSFRSMASCPHGKANNDVLDCFMSRLTRYACRWSDSWPCEGMQIDRSGCSCPMLRQDIFEVLLPYDKCGKLTFAPFCLQQIPSQACLDCELRHAVRTSQLITRRSGISNCQLESLASRAAISRGVQGRPCRRASAGRPGPDLGQDAASDDDQQLKEVCSVETLLKTVHGYSALCGGHE